MNIRNFLHRIVNEFREMLVVFALIAPFYLAAASYRIYLVGEPRGLLFRYGVSLFNAWVLAKIVIIGNLARVGKWTERNPLLVPVLIKAVMFTVLAMAFNTLEAIVRDSLHGQTFFAAAQRLASTDMGEIARLHVIMFFAFIPFFALIEIRRVVGQEKFQNLFLRGTLHDSGNVVTENRNQFNAATSG